METILLDTLKQIQEGELLNTSPICFSYKHIEYFKNEYIVIAWDVPMHGLSVPYNDFSYENTARDLHQILEQEHIEKVCLVGMSMGGYPSQMFAHLYPKKVQCFIGVDTTPFGTAYYSKSDLWWLFTSSRFWFFS